MRTMALNVMLKSCADVVLNGKAQTYVEFEGITL